jgi:hypothetical protein
VLGDLHFGRSGLAFPSIVCCVFVRRNSLGSISFACILDYDPTKRVIDDLQGLSFLGDILVLNHQDISVAFLTIHSHTTSHTMEQPTNTTDTKGMKQIVPEGKPLRQQLHTRETC